MLFNMRIARLVTDFISGRRYRMTTHDNEVSKDMHNNYAYSRAAAELEDLVKSQRRAETVREMSDGKDYDGADIDDSDRRAQGARRKDMRESGAAWRGIQALDDDELFELGDELDDESHTMLVSGRPARIRFPGARGDSELSPVEYIHGDDEEDFPEGRNAIGGDRLARRAVRRGLDSDQYTRGKSLRRGLSPYAFIKGQPHYELIKSRLQDAVCAEHLDPSVLLVFEAASPNFASSAHNVERALASVPRAVAARYGLPSIPGSVYAGMYD